MGQTSKKLDSTRTEVSKAPIADLGKRDESLSLHPEKGAIKNKNKS
jgi:hypothetical protein